MSEMFGLCSTFRFILMACTFNTFYYLILLSNKTQVGSPECTGIPPPAHASCKRNSYNHIIVAVRSFSFWKSVAVAAAITACGSRQHIRMHPAYMCMPSIEYVRSTDSWYVKKNEILASVRWLQHITAGYSETSVLQRSTVYAITLLTWLHQSGFIFCVFHLRNYIILYI